MEEKNLIMLEDPSHESHVGILRENPCARCRNPFGFHTAGESDFGIDEELLVYHEAYDCDFNVISEILTSD